MTEKRDNGKFITKMIGFLTGTVHIKNTDSIILLVGGVGYLVYLPPSILGNISVSSPLDLFIYTHVKEESLDLFGFKTQEDLALYKTLLNVSGIGAKTALNIIDKGAQSVKNAVLTADVEFFVGIPRLGRKNAQKIIIELKNKIGSLNELDLSSNPDNTQILDALIAMGYSKQESSQVIKKIPTDITTLEDKIRFSLKNLGK